MQVAVDIGSEVLILSLCTRFLMSVVVGFVVCAVSDAFSRVPVDLVFSYSTTLHLISLEDDFCSGS